jgi:hypothetical protein
MWIINLLPDFVFHLMVLIGISGLVASLFISFIPFVTQYKLIIQIISVILLTVGIYYEGAISDNKDWKARVTELQNKVTIAEQKSNDLNVELTNQLTKNDQLNKDKENAQTTIIQKVITKYDNTCKLPDDIIRLHDSASQNRIPDSNIGVTTNTPNVTNSKK